MGGGAACGTCVHPLRTRRVTVLLSDEEFELLKRAARYCGMGLSVYLRNVGLLHSRTILNEEGKGGVEKEVGSHA